MIRRLPGITLIEVLVTLVSAGLLLGLAIGLISLSSRAQDGAQNAEHKANLVVLRQTMRRLFYLVDQNSNYATDFDGTSKSVTFISLDRLDALPENAATLVTLTLSEGELKLQRAALNSSGTELTATTDTVAFDAPVTLGYLESCEAGGSWVDTWNRGAPPVALRLTSDESTFWPNYMIFRPFQEADLCDPT